MANLRTPEQHSVKRIARESYKVRGPRMSDLAICKTWMPREDSNLD